MSNEASLIRKDEEKETLLTENTGKPLSKKKKKKKVGNGLTLGSVRRIVKSQMFIFLFLFLCEYIFKAIHHTVQSLLYWLSWEQKTDLVSFVSANAKNKNVLL